MTAVRLLLLIALTLAAGLVPAPALAQTTAQRPPSRPAPARRPPPPPDRFAVRGVGMVGMHWFTAADTFKAVTGSGSTPIYGGGLRLHIPGGAFAEVGAWKYEKDGERVFVTSARQVFKLGIPTTVKMVPLDVTVGWRFRNLFRGITPHLGAGYTSIKYEETSDFAEASENVSERYSGFHVVGGAEVRVHRWVGIAGDVVWTSVADGLGDGGASKAFNEDNLGGTSLRLKIVIGR